MLTERRHFLQQGAPSVILRWWRGLLTMAALSLLGSSLGGSLGAWHWMLDLMSHFRLQYFLLAIAFLVATIPWRTSISTAALAATILWNGGLIAPYYTSPNPKRPGGTQISLVALNVHTANPHKAEVVNYLRQTGAAFVEITEIDGRWADALNALAPLYGYRHYEPRDDNFGIAFLSMWPWQRIETIRHAATGVPSLVAHFNWSNREFIVVVAHTLPPVGRENTLLRDEQMRELAQICARSPHPCVIIGDLNASPWSSAFRDLTREGRLRDSALGFGLQLSWNAQHPLIRIPIDHILVPRSATVERRAVGPDIGSDHFPIEATFRIRPRPPS